MKLKQLRSNLALKILAVFLSGIMAVLIAFSIVDAVVVTLLIESSGTYESARREVANVFSDNLAHSVSKSFGSLGKDVDNIYENANFYYEISDSDGNLIHSNYNGENFWFTTFNEYSPYGHKVKLYIKEKMNNTDNMALAVHLFDFAFNWRFFSIAITLIATLFLIVLLTFLFCSAGHKAGVDGISLNLIDKVPLEIYLSFFAFVLMLEALFLDYYTYDVVSLVFFCIFAVIDFMLLIGFSLSIATRMKSKTLFKNTLVYMFLKSVFKIILTIKHYINRTALVVKTLIFLICFAILDFILMDIFEFQPGVMLFLQYLEKIFLSAMIVLSAIQFKQIKQGIAKVSKGEVDYKIDTENMFFDFKNCATDFNNVGLGLSNAVEEKMKSERFKTELITNVSHDIKTPLTSIINYVDLIKKEEIENEKVKEYLAVLDRQSIRLKKLTDDLIEASKASSGALKVELTPTDIGVLLVQAVGEYQEKMTQNNLELVCNYPSDNVMVLADARHLWRVFDNLMNNIVKYSQENTRVYLNVEKSEKSVVITFKNISKERLNISAEELTKRFVRGDSSRNTSGSGLGLSIAKSLTQLQNAQMEILLDGDLYKVALTFNLLDEKES